jgi:hypothetical protein
VQPPDFVVVVLATEGVTDEKPSHRNHDDCRHGHCLFRQPRNCSAAGTAAADRCRRTGSASTGNNRVNPAEINDDNDD